MSQDKFKVRSVKFNFIMNFILTASSFIFPIITFPYVSRILLSVGTGRVAFATSVIAYFTMFASLGIPSYGIRACASARNNKEKLTRTVHELLALNIVTTVIVYLVFFVTLFTVPKFSGEKTLLIISSFSVVLNTIGVAWLYQGLEQYSYITACNLGCKLLSVVGMFLLIKNPNDYVIYAALTVVASGGSNVLNFIRLKKFIYLRPVGNYNILRHLKPVLVFFATSVAISIYTNLDVVMLGFMKTDSDVGLYNASIKIKTVLTAFLTSLGGVMLPRLTVCIKDGDKARFQNLITKVFNFVFIVAIPLTLFFGVFSKDTIAFLSGADFMGAVPSMIILMPTVFLIALSNTTGIQMLVPMGRENAVMVSVMCGAVVDFLLNLVFIPRYASAGAALSTLIAEIVVVVVQCIYLKDTLKPIIKNLKVYKSFISIIPATVAGVAVYNLADFSHLTLSLCAILRMGLGAIAFFGVYFVLLLIFRDEFILSVIKPILKKLKIIKE